MGRFTRRLYKTSRSDAFDHERDRNVRAQQIYETIDRQDFQWVVVLVAGVGFFLDGYTLFASNIAFPMISYVYFQNDSNSRRGTYINVATLAGTLLGQIIFGFCADKYGRRRMYGAELLLLIAATLGVTMCSAGADDSMSIFAWLIWWRIVVGIGVGADYPLSAVITSELAPTQHRARMLASVFFMQPLGQIAGNIVSLVVVVVARNHGSNNLTRTFDQMWRWVIGIGVLPGILGILFRLAIPETPRFLLDIEDDPIKAEFDAAYLFGDDPHDTELEDPNSSSSVHEAIASDSSTSKPVNDETLTQVDPDIDIGFGSTVTLNSNWNRSRRDIIQYFWHEKNWRTLAGTALSWLLLDFGFYGIGLSNPQFLAKTWGNLNIHGPTPPWRTTDDPNVSVFDMFFNTSAHSLIILNLGSFIGGILMILCAPHINRVALQKFGFLALAALFIAMGTMFMTSHSEGAPAVVLYVIGQILFNFGPNTTTYMLPAELFPTRYRGTCHGVSAAAGKLGSILVQIFGAYYRIGSNSPGDALTRRYGRTLIVFSVVMIVGAAITHFAIPNVQEKGKGIKKYWNCKTKTLEELAIGRGGKLSDIVTRSRRQRDFE